MCYKFIKNFSLLLFLCGCSFFENQSPTQKWTSDRIFEHCIFLDSKKDSKLQEKLNCWIRWIIFSDEKASKPQLQHAYKRIKSLTKGKN